VTKVKVEEGNRAKLLQKTAIFCEENSKKLMEMRNSFKGSKITTVHIEEVVRHDVSDEENEGPAEFVNKPVLLEVPEMIDCSMLIKIIDTNSNKIKQETELNNSIPEMEKIYIEKRNSYNDFYDKHLQSHLKAEQTLNAYNIANRRFKDISKDPKCPKKIISEAKAEKNMLKGMLTKLSEDQTTKKFLVSCQKKLEPEPTIIDNKEKKIKIIEEVENLKKLNAELTQQVDKIDLKNGEAYKAIRFNKAQMKIYEEKIEYLKKRREEYFKNKSRKMQKRGKPLGDYVRKNPNLRQTTLDYERMKEQDFIGAAAEKLSKMVEAFDLVEDKIMYSREIMRPPSIEYIADLKANDYMRYIRYTLMTSIENKTSVPRIYIKRLFEIIDRSGPGLMIREMIDELSKTMTNKVRKNNYDNIKGRRVKKVKRVFNKVFHGLSLIGLSRSINRNCMSKEEREERKAALKIMKKSRFEIEYRSKKRAKRVKYYDSSD
jgi:hypothetical protein